MIDSIWTLFDRSNSQPLLVYHADQDDVIIVAIDYRMTIGLTCYLYASIISISPDDHLTSVPRRGLSGKWQQIKSAAYMTGRDLSPDFDVHFKIQNRTGYTGLYVY